MKSVIGFVLLTISPNREIQVFDELKKLERILEVHPIFGDYDFLIKVDADSPKDLGDYVMQVLRRIDGILDSKTFVTVEL